MSHARKLSLAIDAAVHRQLPGTEVQLLLVANENYTDAAQAERQVERLLARVRAAHPDPDSLAGADTDQAYRRFYREMGLKAAQVSTPVKQVRRVLERGTYRSISRTIDIAMEIEYATLVSFQLYDAGAIGSQLEYRLAIGEEPMTTMSGEQKLCKPGELILQHDRQVVHSSYYGNENRFRLGPDADHAILRILRVPGVAPEPFECAVDEARTRMHVLAGARSPGA